MSKDKHITILAILSIVRGGILLIVGLLGFTFLTGIGLATGEAIAFGILGMLGSAALILLGAIAAPSIIAGIGLLRHHEWARVLTLIVGFLSLLDVPLGTAYGVYAIWVLMDQEAKDIFSGRGRPTQPVAHAA